jgi:hypothetical protein
MERWGNRPDRLRPIPCEKTWIVIANENSTDRKEVGHDAFGRIATPSKG